MAKPMGPRAAEPAPPVLVLHQAGPLAVLRIHDLSYSPIVSVIAQALPADVQQLMLVTPTDTKMFNLTEAHESSHVPTTTKLNGSPRSEVAHTESSEAETDFDSDPQAQAIRDAEQSERETASIDVEAAQAEANTAETPAQRREALKQLRRASGEAGSDATCGRCRGAGQINVALPDGGATQSSCPVCQGRGTIRRYGGGRR